MHRYTAVLILLLVVAGLPAQGKYRQVSGRVVDEEFKPLEGVRLLLTLGLDRGRPEDRREPVGATGADGRFSIRLPVPEGLRQQLFEPKYLVFEAEGRLSAGLILGGRGAYMSSRLKHALGTIVLPKGEPIQVRIRKAGGRPLANALVTGRSPVQTSNFFLLGQEEPEYFSRATTDAKGAAVIYNQAPDGVSVVVQARGYYRKRIPLHSPKMPLVVQLKESGLVSGKVVDHTGEPVIALIMVNWEVVGSNYAGMVFGDGLTEPDGTFEFNLDHGHRFAIGAVPLSTGTITTGRPGFTYSQTLSGPQKDVEIRLDQPKGVDGGVVVNVLDVTSNQPVEQSRVAMFFGEDMPEIYLDMQFDVFSRHVPKGGKVVLPVPKGELTTGLVMIKAKGYSTYIKRGVRWREDKAVRVTAKLSKEIPLTGVVVEKESGEPIAGAEVWAKPVRKEKPDFTPIELRPGAVHTDAKGRFALTYLAKGKYELAVDHEEHPRGEATKVELRNEALEVKLELQRGVSFAGKVTGAKIGNDWRLMISQDDSKAEGAVFPRPGLTFTTRTESIGQDGAVSFSGLAKGEYTATLVLPHRSGTAMRITLPDKLEIKGDTKEATIDISKSLPGSLQGTLSCKGMHPPLGRLILDVVSESGEGEAMIFRGATGIHGFACTIARDGSFELALPPGEYKLEVMDASTGTVLLEDKQEIRSATIARKNLQLELALVRVRLVPAQDGGRIVASRLEVNLASGEEDPSPAKGFEYPGMQQPGVSLADGEREIALYLPARETTLRVITNALKLRAFPEPGITATVLGEAEITPRMDEINRVEIKVKAPPKIESSGDKK